MSTLVQSINSLLGHGLSVVIKLRYGVIALLVIGLGAAFAYLITDAESGGLVVSVVAIIILLAIIVNRPLNGLLVWLFFMVFIESWVEIPMGAGIPDMSFSRFAIGFLAIFMLAQAAISKFRFVRPGWVELFMMLTVVGLAMAAPMSIGPAPNGVVQWTIAMYFTPMVAYFFAKNLVQDRQDLHQILWIIALLGFVSGLYAAYEHATGHVLFLPKDKAVGRLFRGESGIRLIQGLMGGTGEMGRALATTIPVTFYLFIERKQMDLIKIALSTMLLIQAYGILITMSRTPWLALLIALFIMQFFYPQFRKVFAIIVLMAVLVIGATWEQVERSTVAARVGDDNSTLEGRQGRWAAAQNMWRRKPIRGWGYGHYEDKSGEYRTDGSRENMDAIESDYWYVLVGGGLLGLFPYLAYIGAILYYSARLFFRARAPDWSGFIKVETLTVVWAVIICLLLTSYTAKQVQPVIRLMTFAVSGAIIGSHEHLLRQNTKDNSPRQ